VINVTPRVAQNDKGRRSAIDGRTTHHSGYAVSIRIRKSIEEAFGWAKTVAGLRKACHRGLPKIEWQFTFAMAAITSYACRNCSARQHDHARSSHCPIEQEAFSEHQKPHSRPISTPATGQRLPPSCCLKIS